MESMGRINQDLRDIIESWLNEADEFDKRIGAPSKRSAGVRKCAHDLQSYLVHADYELEVLDNAVSSAEQSMNSWKAAMSGMLDEMQELVGFHKKHMPSYSSDAFLDLIEGWKKLTET